MQTVRHFFVSNDLDDLETLQLQLQEAGLSRPQLHVLSHDDAAVEKHHRLHDVSSFMKTDVVRSGELGALLGVCAAIVVLTLTWLMDWHTGPAGWPPFLFIALLLVGFATWEGGFIGIQHANKKFERFGKVLAEGSHVFFVDLEAGQEEALEQCLNKHKGISLAGTEKGTPHWILETQRRVPEMLHNI